MRITFFLLATLLSIQTVNAQQKAKAYADMRSFVGGKAATLEGVTVTRRTNGDIKWSGGNDYKITAVDRSVSKDLKKNYWGVEYNDTLMLNMRMIKSTWYAQVLCRTPKHLFFRAGIGNVKGAKDDPTMAIMFGAIGAGIHGAEAAMKRFDYLLDLTTGEIVVLTEKGGGLKNVLASNKELQDKYIKEGMPRDNASYIRFLKELDKSN